MSANSQNAKVMSLLHRYAERMGVPSEQLYATLLKVIFKRSEAVREEELLAFLLVCEKYGLDPFLKEIYPTLTQKTGAFARGERGRMASLATPTRRF